MFLVVVEILRRARVRLNPESRWARFDDDWANVHPSRPTGQWRFCR
jgi:hypothetical protein